MQKNKLHLKIHTTTENAVTAIISQNSIVTEFLLSVPLNG